MVVFRHTDTTSSSQANGISFDISHSCVDFIVRYIHFIHFPVVPLDFFFYHFIPFLVGLRRHGLRELLRPEELRQGEELALGRDV